MQRNSWVLLLLCLGAAGCGAFAPDRARYTFAKQYSCPEERLAMKTVPVKPEQLLDVGKPPADIAADAVRSALWRANRIEDMKDYWRLSAVEITGCATRRTYLCWDVHDKEHETIDSFCETVDLSDPDTKLGEFSVKPEVWQSVRAQLE